MERMIAQEYQRNMFKVCIFVSVDVYVTICVGVSVYVHMDLHACLFCQQQY